MNCSVHFTNNSAQVPGMKLLSNVISENQSQKPQYLSLNRKLPPSRTPDRLFYNDYVLNKTPSIKGMTDRLQQQNHRQNLSIPPPTKNKPADKSLTRNKLSTKRLLDISNRNIIARYESAKHENSFSYSRTKKSAEKNYSRGSGATPGRDFRRLQPISNSKMYKPKLSELGSGNLIKNEIFLKAPPAGSGQNQSINSSFQQTRKNSLAQVNSSLPSDGVPSSFLTSIGSTGVGGTFITDQPMEKDGPKVRRSQHNPRAVLHPLAESNIPTQKFTRLSQKPSNQLHGTNPSLKFDSYRRARMQYQQYKERNLSMNHNNRSYNLNNRSKGKSHHL